MVEKKEYINKNQVFLDDNPSTGVLIGYKDKKAKNIVLDSRVKKINDYAFWDCQSLQSISISDKVTEIGEDVFGWCIKLKSISMPNSVKKIGKSAISDCDDLEEINIKMVKSENKKLINELNELVSKNDLKINFI